MSGRDWTGHTFIQTMLDQPAVVEPPAPVLPKAVRKRKPRYTKHCMFRLTDAQLTTLKRSAELVGMTISDYVRFYLFERREQPNGGDST